MGANELKPGPPHRLKITVHEIVLIFMQDFRKLTKILVPSHHEYSAIYATVPRIYTDINLTSYFLHCVLWYCSHTYGAQDPPFSPDAQIVPVVVMGHSIG